MKSVSGPNSKTQILPIQTLPVTGPLKPLVNEADGGFRRFSAVFGGFLWFSLVFGGFRVLGVPVQLCQYLLDKCQVDN